PLTGLPGDLFTPGGVEFWGKVNFLKAGLVFADLLSTVSLTYSQEIQTLEFGYGLDAVLRQRAGDLSGVLNGVDYQDWNPRTDPYLVGTYSPENLAGKAACKRAIQEMVGLPTRAAAPLLGVVSRLAYQKGIDLIVATAERLLSLDLQIVMLGTGDVELERALQNLHRRFPDRLAVQIRFDVELSHKVVAGADMVLIPSRYEPCGLNQMYGLAYGTIPVVRATGGLRDTIIPFDPGAGTGNGFTFNKAEAGDLLQAVRLAIALFHDKAVWGRLMKNAMAADFSWERPAREYERLYRLAVERRRHPTP
ncbi:MAG: glycogen synthase, partial [Candidatus Methylomirabilales bacterium]